MSEVYDETLPFFAEFGREFVDALAPGAGAAFLDVGAGRGAVARRALDHGCRVTAIDAAPGMVRRLADAYPSISAFVMDTQQLTFAGGTFDVVAASFVMHLLDDVPLAAAEIRRVLKPGGVFALTVPTEVRAASEVGSPLGVLFKEFTPLLLPGSGRLGRPLDAATLLEGAGFEDVQKTHIEVCLPVPNGEVMWQWVLSHGSRAFVDGLPEHNRQEFRARLVSEIDKQERPVLHRAASIWSGRAPTAA